MKEHEGEVEVFNGKLKQSADKLLQTKNEINHVKSECLELERECLVPVVVVEGVDDETMKLLTEQFAALQSDWDEDSFRNLEGSYKELMERSTKAV